MRLFRRRRRKRGLSHGALQRILAYRWENDWRPELPLAFTTDTPNGQPEPVFGRPGRAQ